MTANLQDQVASKIGNIETSYYILGIESGLNRAAKLLKDESGELFKRGKDNEATLLRKWATRCGEEGRKQGWDRKKKEEPVGDEARTFILSLFGAEE